MSAYLPASALLDPGVLLVTGTDTGVGKTWVGCGLVRALKATGRRVVVRKPAESGCERRGEVLIPADAVALRDAAGCEEPLERVCALRLEEPLAPGVAAERAGIAIDPTQIAAEIAASGSDKDLVVVEGAGGLLVPLAGRYLYADLARDLQARLLVVVGARLGAINHTLLTLEVATARGLPVLGVVVNHPNSEVDLATETLATSLRRQTDATILAEIRHGEDAALSFAKLLGVP